MQVAHPARFHYIAGAPPLFARKMFASLKFLPDTGFETKQKQHCDVPEKYSLKGIGARY